MAFLSWIRFPVLLLFGLWCGVVKAEEAMKRPDLMAAPLSAWTSWSPRPEIAPRFAVDTTGGRSGGEALRIACDTPAAFGAWRRRVEGITPGRAYRFTAYYRVADVPQAQRSVSARLDWRDAKGQWARPPDYVPETGRDGAWTRVEQTVVAPDNAESVTIEVSLGWAAKGTVWWDGVTLREEDAPPGRVVRALTVFHRPRGSRSPSESVAAFCRLVEQAADRKPDIVCLPEGITVVGTGKTYAEVAEPIPGPTTETLGALAKKLRCYIVAGIYERSGGVVYNTAVLVGRDGRLVGAYRKTHLPREEIEGGITPGDAYPVFETDFGTLGILICWDVQFPEPARALALAGAEVVLLPIWGGSEVLAKARAIENHVFLVTSSYDMKTFIVDPAGGVLAEATPQEPVALAELHLDRKIVQPWLGDMKTRTWKERRPDIPVDAPLPGKER